MLLMLIRLACENKKKATVNRATRPVVPQSCLVFLESCAMPGLEFLADTQGRG